MNTLFRVVILVLVPTILAADNGAKGESFVCVGDSTVGFIFESAS